MALAARTGRCPEEKGEIGRKIGWGRIGAGLKKCRSYLRSTFPRKLPISIKIKVRLRGSVTDAFRKLDRRLS